MLCCNKERKRWREIEVKIEKCRKYFIKKKKKLMLLWGDEVVYFRWLKFYYLYPKSQKFELPWPTKKTDDVVFIFNKMIKLKGDSIFL